MPVIVEVEMIDPFARYIETLPEPTSIQECALDLYHRGWNVLPLPRPHEVKAWAAELPDERDATAKPPYLLEPFFYGRLHVCGPECAGRNCTRPGEGFADLFEGANVGAMMGRTSGNLACLDCDCKSSFDGMRAELTRRNIPFLAYSSHRGGGCLIRVAEGELSNIPAVAGWEDVQIWGNRHYCVMPPSVHATGDVYQWVTPIQPHGETIAPVSVKALDWLGATLAVKERRKPTQPELYGLPEWAAQLSQKTRRALTSEHENGARNNALTPAVYDVAALVVTGSIEESEAESVLMDAAAASSYPVGDMRAMLKSAIKKAPLSHREYMGAQPKPQSRPWQVASKFATSYDWRIYGRMAQTCRALFLACVQRARMDDSAIFRGSERELAELANFGQHKRARRGLTILLQDADNTPALLRKIGNLPNGATRWAFTDNVTLSPNDPTIYPFNCVVGSLEDNQNMTFTSDSERDVFTRLGFVAWRVYRYLLLQPARNAGEISRALKIRYSSVFDVLGSWKTKHENLSPLRKHGLVIYSQSEGLFMAEPKSEIQLEKLAAVFGSLGTAAKRKRDNEREREVRLNRQVAKARAYWKAKYQPPVYITGICH